MKSKRLVPPVGWKLDKVISGAQVGADIAGLRAAKACGIPTGGLMPLGFLAVDGLHPEYASEYRITEAPMVAYRHRTIENVKASDGTIRIAYRWSSPGELCTLRAIGVYRKPYLDISPSEPMKPRSVACWIRDSGIKVLNVAGNADVHLETFVEAYLRDVFRFLL